MSRRKALASKRRKAGIIEGYATIGVDNGDRMTVETVQKTLKEFRAGLVPMFLPMHHRVEAAVRVKASHHEVIDGQRVEVITDMELVSLGVVDQLEADRRGIPMP